MKIKGKQLLRRGAAMFLTLAMAASLIPSTLAAQQNSYHDPAEHWQEAMDRTNEFDSNSVVTVETFDCRYCDRPTAFDVFRVPEYTKNGVTALSRNVKYSDGTCLDTQSRGDLMDGTPGVDATYTGYHWTKAVCKTCGTVNSNMDTYNYAYAKNVYWLYDCAANFMEELPETKTIQQADGTYHRVITASGTYCGFCYGTRKETSSTLERHHMEDSIRPELSNQRFVEMASCSDCGYAETAYTAAKAVIADYFGTADGQPHTVTVSDLSEAGVTTAIRYGHSADACTLTTAPSYTEAGDYPVYYEITYAFSGATMVESGVAFVHLRGDTSAPENDGDGTCGEEHNWILLDSVAPTCLTLGYDRYLCVDCGAIEKRDYEAALGHAYQSIVIRDATCETSGKVLEICERCGTVKESTLPQGEHAYSTLVVSPTCTSPGYTVRECSVCGDRHITDITSALAHNYKATVVPATCEAGGKTIHSCEGCGSSFVTDYTDPLGHSWDEGTLVTDATCTGEGITEYRCVRCGYHRLEGNVAAGHVPGEAATCTTPQLCTNCGAVLQAALGHDYQKEVTAPTCTEMGYTTYTCSHCGDTYKGDYTDATGHTPSDWIIDKEPTTTAEGSKHKECVNCGETLETAEIEKVRNQVVTDGNGEASVDGYLVTVTDTDTKAPVSKALVTLHADNSLSVRLPSGRLLDYDDQTTICVQLLQDKSPVKGMEITVTDRNDNFSSGSTNSAGKLTVPGSSDTTNGDDKPTVGWEDDDGDRWTLTVTVKDYETGRLIDDAQVSVGKNGTITVVLPDGERLDEDHRVTVTVTDNRGKPIKGQLVIVQGDRGQWESGKTDDSGKLTVPGNVDAVLHSSYIMGYPDQTFGPSRSMTRGEAAAIFARLLAQSNGDRIPTATITFRDMSPYAWYAGYVTYLVRQGVAVGYSDGCFRGDEPITRSEFTAMAVRFVNACGLDSGKQSAGYWGFTDVSGNYWALEYIMDAALNGWVIGYGNGTFRGEDDISRAEVVTIVNRVLEREADRDYIAENRRWITTFPDVSWQHWAYYDILEAANGHYAVLEDGEVWCD